ncbi:MAG: hypothetical protein A3G34_01280 [Candidatus Lindowbacteria bacterium RIFCSPLOWO2_12_FULL_62_27]|nr:MAG: hypothetical protein A3G34_01280 [Candidatus Lindowbacteria bacterium RIFCSPLOWO2_12_FULL_62_27]OGH63701.1 MAG: hypothetical protein A3I06_07730 [Candidatus Lindowbacteria bacterium RIFCSPLOWO2_02_FULL_62_12]
MIYFQVLDRTLRTFLNDVMLRFPFQAGAGETPPGLTDALIFYDPLVKPTRPGRILPARLVTLLEEGRPQEAETLLVQQILEAAENAMVEHDSEMEMLTIEEEEHRLRIRQIDDRRRQLLQLTGQLNAAESVLKEWEVPQLSAAPAVPSEAAPAAPEPDSQFFSHLRSRIRAIMEGNGGLLSVEDIDEPFRLAVDLGLAPAVKASDVRRALSIGSGALTGGGHRVWHLSDWLVRQFADAYQVHKMREMEEALRSIRSAIDDLKVRLDRLREKRRNVFYSVGINLDPDLDRLAHLQRGYCELDGPRRKGQLSLEDKSRHDVIKDEIEEIERKLESEIYLRFASSPEFMTSFRRLNQAVSQSLQELIHQEEDDRDKREMLDKLAETYRRSTPDERLSRMDEQIGQIRQFTKLLTDRGRRRPFQPVTPPPWPVTPPAVLSALDRITAQDTSLFPEKFLRRRGPPGILLLPVNGAGLYDWQGGMLVISLYPENLDSAILTALAEFRMDADESKELFNSYGQIKRYRGFAFAKLKETFMSDYVTWVLKEAAGYRVMETDVRMWFERKIPLEPLEKPAGRASR